MVEDSIKSLEKGVKGISPLLSLETDSKRHFYSVKYLHKFKQEQLDVGTINLSSKEFGRLSNGNVPPHIVESLEKYLLKERYRVSSPFNYGIGEEESIITS